MSWCSVSALPSQVTGHATGAHRFLPSDPRYTQLSTLKPQPVLTVLVAFIQRLHNSLRQLSAFENEQGLVKHKKEV